MSAGSNVERSDTALPPFTSGMLCTSLLVAEVMGILSNQTGQEVAEGSQYLMVTRNILTSLLTNCSRS
jgi:hypothetical protein